MSSSAVGYLAVALLLCVGCDKKTEALSTPDHPIPVGTRTEGEGANQDTKRDTDKLEAPQGSAAPATSVTPTPVPGGEPR